MATQTGPTHKVIFLNGPPGAGKDEAGKAIAKHFNTRLFKMSAGLKQALPTLLGLSDELAKYLEAEKDAPQNCFEGLSWRQMQIKLAEEFVKPILGPAAFGHIAVRKLMLTLYHEITAITDVGFRAEMIPIVHWAWPKNCLLVHIRREGHTYEKDSRSYIELSDLGVTTVEVNNHYPNTEYYHTKIKMVIDQWLATQRS